MDTRKELFKDVDHNIWEDLSFYFKAIAKHKEKTRWTIIFFFIKRLPITAISLGVMIIIDNYIPAGDFSIIAKFLGILLIGLILNAIYNVAFASITNAELMKNVSRDLRNRIVDKLQLLSIGYHKQNHSGRLYSKIMSDVDKLEQFAKNFLQFVLITIVDLTFAISILANINIQLLTAYLIIIPFYFLIYMVFRKNIKLNQRKSRLAQEKITASIVSFVQTQELARMHGEEEFEVNRVKTTGDQSISKLISLRALTSMFEALSSVLGQVMNIVIVGIGAIAVINETLTLGQLILFTSYVFLIVQHINGIVNFFPQLSEFSESVQSIKEILYSPDIERNAGKVKVEDIKGCVTFQNVSFRYDEDKLEVFHDLNIKLSKGKTIALVGGSGSGKSTFINLMLGLFRPDAGTVRIDEYDINEVDMRTVRQYVGVVTQEAIIFSGSVRENITHGSSRHTEDEIIQAAKDAHAYDFIMELENGFDTILGDKGATLSGGQRQRISIARAILRKPKLLILDEATSALDPKSEEEVQKAFEKLKGRQTTYIIAHRLSTIRFADNILVFKNGEIIEQGTHEDLLQLKGEYANLYSVQMNMGVDQLNELNGSAES